MKSRETDGWAPSSYDLCKDNERERDYRAMHDGSGWEPSANDEGACVGGRFEDC